MIRTTLKGLADLFLPNLCVLCEAQLGVGAEYVCDSCWGKLTPFPERTTTPLRPLRGVLDHLWIGWEYEARVRRIVHLMKFEGRPELARKLVEEWLRIIVHPKGLQDFDLLLPVPIHPARRRERGFNQSELLARELGSILNLPVAEGDALRVINTPSQTLLDRAERWHSVAEAFRLRPMQSFQRRKVLVVDDLATSGATLHALATLLRRCDAAAVGGAVLTSPCGLDSQS